MTTILNISNALMETMTNLWQNSNGHATLFESMYWIFNYYRRYWQRLAKPAHRVWDMDKLSQLI